MTELTFLGLGIGCWFVVFSLLFIWLFKRRSFGLLEPLSVFLILRVAPMLSALLVLLANETLTLYLLLFFMAAILFIFTIYARTPKLILEKTDCSGKSVAFFFLIGFILLAIKIIIIVSSTGILPVFSNMGSNAYIDFNNENKLGSTFLLGIGNSNLVLFAFILPFLKKMKWRICVYLLFFISVVFGLFAGKKASLLSIFLAVALGDYLRVIFISNQKTYFLSLKSISIGIIISIFWAAMIYIRTLGADIASVAFDFNLVSQTLDFLMVQFSYPFFIFSSGELSGFFEGYEFNHFRYIFHSLLSPLGFPAFLSSIGPAITEYQTGNFSENGITPTFIIEGYVLFGNLMPLYAFFLAIAITKGRTFLIRTQSLDYKIIMFAFFYPILYTPFSDALLFLKMLYVLIFLFILIVVPLKVLLYAKS
ncbi:hypothetical protein MCEWOLH11_00864 [Candidatus Methylopumilus universalis]|uniref:O-antigen polymerase n=1 Tax=Candidatus Methylopumilus universalis TaxID=2588536 RepID=UPI003BEF2D11